MPFNNYSTNYVFKGQVQSETTPSEDNDLVRKQDVSGLSYISSIASGSSSYLSVTNGELSVSNLLVTDVKVNTTDSSLSDYITNSASSDNLGVGDIVILTAPSANLMYIVKSGSGSQTSDFEEIQSSLTAAEIASNLTGGTGIEVTSAGTINFNGDTDDVSEGSTNLYYTNARSRAAVSAGTGITYDSSTGVIGCSITQYTDVDARSAFSYGKGIDIASGGTLLLDFTEFDTSDLVEGSTNLFYTDARSRAAVSGGDGLDYNSSTGAFSLDLKASSGLAFDTGELTIDLGQGLGISPDGVLEVEAGDGLTFVENGTDLIIDNDYFRKEFSSQSFTANTAKTINHALGKKYVHVSIYDSSDNLVHAEVSLSDADNLTITTSDSLTGVTVVVSI